MLAVCSMMSRKLSEESRVLVAGAKYVASRSAPVHPKSIDSWHWIKYEPRGENIELTSKNGVSVLPCFIT